MVHSPVFFHIALVGAHPFLNHLVLITFGSQTHNVLLQYLKLLMSPALTTPLLFPLGPRLHMPCSAWAREGRQASCASLGMAAQPCFSCIAHRQKIFHLAGSSASISASAGVHTMLLHMGQGGQASQLHWPWCGSSALFFLHSPQMENLPPGWELCFDQCQHRHPYYADHSTTSATWTWTCPLVNPAMIAPHTHAPTQVAKEILTPNMTNACGTYTDAGLPLSWEKLGMPLAKPAVDRSVTRPCVICLIYAHSIYSAPCPEVMR